MEDDNEDYYRFLQEYYGNDSEVPIPSAGYTDFFYMAFSFARPIYLYVWEILVIFTTIFNVIIILVLVRRRLFSSTNIILIAIAISDSLTGLVTLPTYIHVYNQFIPGGQMGRDSYKLSKSWCEAFMISKFFVSRSFHTISIWLTVCLALLRFIAVCFPFKAPRIVTIRGTVICVAGVCILAPLMHVYHLVNVKTEGGTCSWDIELTCKDACAYLWIQCLLMHLVPCVLLVALSSYMLIALRRSSSHAHKNIQGQRKGSIHSSARQAGEKRITYIVILVVVIFLIPELPYGLYLLSVLMLNYHTGNSVLLSLRTGHTFECVYEILLVISFHANFWVYTVMSRQFREGVLKQFPCIEAVMKRCSSRTTVVSVDTASNRSQNYNTNTDGGNTHSATEMKTISLFSATTEDSKDSTA